MVKVQKGLGSQLVSLHLVLSPGDPKRISEALDERLRQHLEMFVLQHNYCNNNSII
jgi:hypothetical protein